MAKDDDLLGNAIIATEKEIAAGAWDAEPDALDPTGDRSLEEMGEGLEGQHDDDEAEDPDDGADDDAHPKEEPENPDAVETKDKPKEGEVIAPEPQGRVPAGRLREEAEAKRKAEAERDALKAQLDAAKANEKTSFDALRAEFDRKLAEQIAALKPAPVVEKPKAPDLFEDPLAFAEHINKGVQERFDAFQRQQRDREINASIDSARTRHGETFANAWKALESLPKSPETAQLVQRLEAQPNPGEAIVSWHKRNVAAREVGDDLEGYKARIAEETRKQLASDPEFRKELLASLRGDAEIGDNGRPRTAVRLPPALARAAGGNGRGLNDDSVLDGSDQAIAESAWR
jgi:hypothetical protein